jgi:DNA invertase Pin-like site-specific DNA recombinase
MSAIAAVPYLRVSTDDKGQRPERQLQVIEPWAARESVNLLPPVIDEGTSATSTNPFERPRFISACELAAAAGAAGIVVETADRFTRQGSKEDGWAEVELQRRYGLRLLRADKPLEQHGTLVGDTVDALKAEVAREWAREHGKKVRSGMARAKQDGQHVGRPRKELTTTELNLVQTMRASGSGWRAIALAVSRARGAFEVADPKRRRQLAVSHMHIRRAAVTEAHP